MPIENNEPQDGNENRQSDTGWIQEQVIQKDVHDYWAKQHKREGHKTVHEQKQAANDL